MTDIYNQDLDDDALYELAEQYDDADEYEKALPIYEKLANKGHAEAQEALGNYYEYGDGVDQDIEKAFEWYVKSAMQGNPKAMVNLGNLYKGGKLSNGKSIEKAVGWYEKAKELGCSDAFYEIGHLYKDGLYYEKDLQKAIDCYSKALEFAVEENDKSVIALYLGLAYEEAKEHEKAVEYYKQAAEFGESLAYLKLGSIYELGRGVEKDYHKAFTCYSVAYNKGVTAADYMLGRAYHYGLGTEVNFEKAIALYRHAAADGNKNAAKIMEVLQPFLIDESHLIDILTDKLIEVAQKPSMRKVFSVTCDVGDGHTLTVVFHKNMPPMFAMEEFFMTAYYVDLFEWMAGLESIPEEILKIIFDRTAPWIQPVADKELRLRFHRSLMEIFSKLGNKECYEHERIQYEKWEQMESKPYRVEKGSFDYWYAKAEKRDWEAMIDLSVWYRRGIAVRKNERLAEFWKNAARSTYHYYEPQGRHFEEVYAEEESELTKDNSNESSTN